MRSKSFFPEVQRRMPPKNIAGHPSIGSYVGSKLRALRESDGSFEAIFPMMFSERENTVWEETRGYRIVKTSYGEVFDEAVRLSGAIRERFSRLGKGSVIAIAAENGPLWIALLWGVLRAGFNPLLVNPSLGRDALSSVLAESSVAGVVTDSKALPFPCPEILPEGCAAVAADSLTGGEGFEPDGFGTEIIFLSSGTSSHVKCCAYGARQIKSQILDAAYIIRKSPDAKKHCDGELKLLALLPFSHIFGFTAVYLWFSFFSRTFVRLGDLSPSTLVNTVKKHRVTHIMAVPLFWEKTCSAAMKEIAARGDRTLSKFRKGLAVSLRLGRVPALGRAFSRVAMREVRENIFGDSIRFAVTGGSLVSRETLEFFNGIGYPLRNGYGMTETGITSVELSSRTDVLCSGSVGKPLPSAVYSLNEAGELISSGTSRAIRTSSDGVVTPMPADFNTRDLARTDRKGRWFIAGRSDELVIDSSGENLNPSLIEPLFSGCGAKEVCLCRTGRDGGAPVATLVLSAGRYASPATAEAIKNSAEDLLSSEGLTGRIGRIFITCAPLMEEGDFKLNRRKVGERVSSGAIAPADIAETAFEAADRSLYLRVRAAFEAALPGAREGVADTADFFSDCGGSSFEWFAMAEALSEELGISFPRSAEGLSTIKDIYNFAEDNL